jgi:hypothetical protein
VQEKEIVNRPALFLSPNIIAVFVEMLASNCREVSLLVGKSLL